MITMLMLTMPMTMTIIMASYGTDISSFQEYVDDSLKIAIFKHAIIAENTTEDAIAAEIKERFEDELPHVLQGETAQLGSSSAKLLNYIPVDLFELVPDKMASNTVIKLSVLEAGEYVIFANHFLSEWEGSMRFMMDVHGDAVIPDASSQCHSTLSSSTVWGLSILGAMIGAVMSLSGVLIVAPVIRMKEVWVLKYLNFFAAGVLLSFVLVHLIPEAGNLTGRVDWKVSTTVLAGFFAGLLIEHSIHLFFTPQVTEQATIGVASGNLAERGELVLVDHHGEATKVSEKENAQEIVAWGRIGNILIGDFFHNFFDGVSTAIAFKYCGTGLGWIVVGASVAHELPQELSDFVVLYNSGLSIKWALISNLMSSLSAVLGSIVILAATESIEHNINHDMGLCLGFGGGLLLYIGTGLVMDIVKVSDVRSAMICWLSFILGAVALGLTALNHIHCECFGDESSHEGHNH
ncbi:hypothetical protein GUITHDRAFT_121403 [Guillardia theta CCMP2712]|uniref:Uncharacterized protein n=1 Tax=Guillardia theta (strain CCMP2712) TaxID=905079 RepID=L1I959_GUITC|nr:hypothetical protein GUITHDRAFT_121403 [Guillardia theta CCMP2712]EKX32439.1 hypothetical protein GUITHDRAFT_121403 [Guillardia theta CCMP2712]|eukprot:XP_005819419.1 hypothetical protein GUITHDRAFT_121403 [Guillardia theta CCMP2712]